MTVVEVSCAACGTGLPPNSKFCNECGAAVSASTTPAEYKQVTVLFADVVHSMDIAAAVGSERLREIMAELLDRSTGVVKRYGGTVSQFTGDGIMAVFGAPVSLEDHALRACLAAHDIQHETVELAKDVMRRDGVALQLRIGLNSGQVIAGEIGTSASGYTTIGEQVGMAQRMESAAPPGRVLLSESTARLVEDSVVLGGVELVHIKGANSPVPAQQLLNVGEHHTRRRSESKLVGRTWELNTITGILEEVIGGAGCVVNVVGPPGIGKSRLVREASAIATGRGVAVFTTYCESHTSDLPFHAVARLLRSATGIDKLAHDAARAQLRAGLPDANEEDLLFVEDLVGVADPAVPLPVVAADARLRRLTALLNSASLARTEPAVYVIEDAHWIDESSESMFAEFFKVIPQTPSLVLITYRPEYQGALTKVSGAQTIGLRPLNESQTSELTATLMGPDPSVSGLAALIGSRAAGNPFFVEEMLRDVVERGKLLGGPGAYQLSGDVSDVNVPATLQATIGARIDRLNPNAKRALNAAAVIGMRFDAEQLNILVDTADLTTLVDAELLDQVRFNVQAEFAFRHPMIRTVAYESQLKSDRAQLHRRLAEVIQARGPADENAALIAEHLEAAGDLHAAYAWHMRAGNWSLFRDIAAARTSWRRAQGVADNLPADDPDQLKMRIEPRTLLCGTAYRSPGDTAQAGFDELRALCAAAGDRRSLAISMAGMVTAHGMNGDRREATQLATELIRLLESIDDPNLTVGMSFAAMGNRYERGEVAEVLRLAQRVIDLSDGDPTKGNILFGSPVAIAIAFRGSARCCMNIPGWQEDLETANAMARAFEPAVLAAAMSCSHVTTLAHEVRLPDADAMRETDEMLSLAEQAGELFTLRMAQASRAVALVRLDGPERRAGLELFARLSAAARDERFGSSFLPIADIEVARENVRTGDFSGAIELSRDLLKELYACGWGMWIAPGTSVLVEALLRRGDDGDLQEAQTAVDRLAAAPTDPGFVINEIWLLRLRALLARAEDDSASYRDYRDRYRKMANELGFEGHMAMAEAMP